jgi:hypothetical protein
VRTSISAPQGAPFPHHGTAQRPPQGEVAGETCGHRCPADPDWTPCQRPPGHDPEYGHRDSAGTDVQHVWHDHSPD